MKVFIIALLTLFLGTPSSAPAPKPTPVISIVVSPTPKKAPAFNISSGKVIPNVAQRAIDQSPVLENITPTIPPTSTSTPTPTPESEPIIPPVTITPWPSRRPCPPRQLPLDLPEQSQARTSMPCID